MADEIEAQELPRFAGAFLGYDRYQVEEYIERLQEWAAATEAHLREAERVLAVRDEELKALKAQQKELAELPEDSADRAGALLMAAYGSVVDLRQRAAEESERMLNTAKDEALEIVRLAREMADDFVQQAQLKRDRADKALSELANDITRFEGAFSRLEQEFAGPPAL